MLESENRFDSVMESLSSLASNIRERALYLAAMAVVAMPGCAKSELPLDYDVDTQIEQCLLDKVPGLFARVCKPEETAKLLNEAIEKCPSIGSLDQPVLTYQKLGGRQKTTRDVGTAVINRQCRETKPSGKTDGGGAVIVPMITN